jgi:predicted dehydrogenase
MTRQHPDGPVAREEIPLAPVPTAGQDACLAEFLDAVADGREPECNGADNLRSLAIVFAAIRSAEECRPVEIAELLGEE